jgi:hypothetical protein
MLNSPSSSLLKAIDRWENEGGAIALMTKVRSRPSENNRTGTFENNVKEPADRHLRKAHPRKTVIQRNRRGGFNQNFAETGGKGRWALSASHDGSSVHARREHTSISCSAPDHD